MNVKLRMKMTTPGITLGMAVLLTLLTSCARFQPYRYTYTRPIGPRTMTPLKVGNRTNCSKLFPPGAYFQSGSAVQIPPDAVIIGPFIAIHGKDVKYSPIYEWRSDDGKQWYVFDIPGPDGQLRAHSPQDFVSQIEGRFGE